MPYKDPEKAKEANRKSAIKHKDKIREKQRKFNGDKYKADPEKGRENSKKKYYARLDYYREKARIYKRESYARNPAPIKDSVIKSLRRKNERLTLALILTMEPDK